MSKRKQPAQGPSSVGPGNSKLILLWQDENNSPLYTLKPVAPPAHSAHVICPASFCDGTGGAAGLRQQAARIGNARTGIAR